MRAPTNLLDHKTNLRWKKPRECQDIKRIKGDTTT